MTIDYLLSTYSGKEILDLARKGLLYIDAYDVSKIVCAATEELYSKEEYEAYGEAQYDIGHSHGYDSGYQQAEDDYA